MKSAVAVAVAIAAGSVVGSSVVLADYVPVIGGPTYDSVAGTGYQANPSAFYETHNVIGGEGTGLTTVGKSISNTTGNSVPVQWSSGGFTEYALPAISGSGTAIGIVNGQNASGVAVGQQRKVNSAGSNNNDQAIRWNSANQPTVLANGISGTLVGSYAGSINAAGTAVGSSYQFQLDSSGFFYNTTFSRPVRWAAGGVSATPLSVAGTTVRTTTTNSGDAAGIAADGTTYGTVYAYQVLSPTSSGNFELTAVRWDADGTALTELGHAPAPTNGYSEDNVTIVRPNGVVAGRTQTTVNGVVASRTPTRWTADGNVTVLDLPANAIVTGGWNQVTGLNDAGTAVGRFTTQASGFDGLRPARWNAGTSAVTELGLLGTPVATTSAWPLDINNAGLAVGVQRARAQDGDGVAVLWGLDGAAVDLNTFIDPSSNWTLVESDSISDTGWVAGIGSFDPDGPGGQAAYYRAFLIQVPEPAAPGVLGLAAIGLRRYRRR